MNILTGSMNRWHSLCVQMPIGGMAFGILSFGICHLDGNTGVLELLINAETDLTLINNEQYTYSKLVNYILTSLMT